MNDPPASLARTLLDPVDWTQAVAARPDVELVAMWADTARAHALLRDGHAFRAISVSAAGARYPALSPHRIAASGMERMIADLWGHRAEGARDLRPWLDHGRWPHTAPLSPKPLPRAKPPEPPALLVVEGEGLHQWPQGPVRDGIAEPAHLRAHVAGGRIVGLEARLGYAHKGTLALMRGKSPRAAARFAGRLSGDATVGHAIAFARAAEAATQTPAPPRAAALRAAMAELERIGGHLFDVGATCAAAGADLVAAAAMRLREAVSNAAAAAFESRSMMDAVIPGGVAADLAAGGIPAIGRLADHLDAGLPALVSDVATHPGLAERLHGLGRVTPELARAFAPGGIVGRAAGRTADPRQDQGVASSRERPWGVRHEGCAHARTALRLDDARAGVAALRALTGALPDGAVSVPLPMASGEGFGCAEAHRGEAWHWLALDGGLIASVFMHDPSWLHWPLLESVCIGADICDLPIIEASFGASISGVDL